jgi:hypothetical protein
MLENTLVKRLLHTNIFIIICVIFTVATLLDLILTVVFFGDVGTTYAHLGARIVLSIFGASSLLIFRFLKKLPFALIIFIHLLTLLVFTALYVQIYGIFIEQHPRAMFYMIRSVLIVYPIIGIGCIVTDRILKTRRKKDST